MIVTRGKYYPTKAFVQYRLDRDWTQEDMSGFLTLQLGRPFSMSLLQKWEQRTRPVRPEMCIEISKILNINVRELFEMRGSEPVNE